MADAKKNDKKDDKSAPDPAAAGKKKKFFAIGGIVGGLALAFMAALFAVPKPRPPMQQLAGPFVGAVTPSKVQVNLSDGRSFLVLELNLLYEAYSADYLATRTADAVCQAEIRDALVAICSSKSRNDISDKVNKPVFLEEIRHALEPLLFPIHVGEGDTATQADPASGLLAGESMPKSTFKGLFEESVLSVDAVQKKISIDGGASVTFKGDERDLEFRLGENESIYLDVSRLKGGFVGSVRIGIKGRTKRVLWNEILIQ